jgi:hypothetical protein
MLSGPAWVWMANIRPWAKRGQEMWEDIWGFIGPLIEQVMTTGEPVWFEDQLVPFLSQWSDRRHLLDV